MFKKPAMNDALVLLSYGVPVATVAEKIGRNKNTVYLWMKQPKFAEALRVEIQRAMSESRRELGQLARRAISSASKSMDQLEQTRDNPGETSAARDRAAHRMLQNAFKWGQVLDENLESGEASGRYDGSQPVNFERETQSLTTCLHRAVQILRMLETQMQKAGIAVQDNIIGMVKWAALERYADYLDKEEVASSALLKHAVDSIPEKQDNERDLKDDARRAKYRASEMAGTAKPEDIDEEGEDVNPQVDPQQPASGKSTAEKPVYGRYPTS